MKIQEGHLYKNGNGDLGIASRGNEGRFPWVIGSYSYTEDGKYYSNEDESKLDIIAEISVPSETATLRDQFAMVALQILIRPPRDMARVFELDGPQDVSGWVRQAYVLADAMLEARKGKAKS